MTPTGDTHELRHQDRAAERRQVRHLARGRGRPLHGAGVQAAAARGDRAGRRPRSWSTSRTRPSSTPRRSASSSAASSASARTTASSRSSAATGTSRRSSRSRASTGSSRSIRRATRRSRSWERPAAPAGVGLCAAALRGRPRARRRVLAAAAARAEKLLRWRPAERGKALLAQVRRLPHARRGRLTGTPARTSTTRSGRRQQGFKESTIQNVVLDQIAAVAADAEEPRQRPGRPGRRRLRRRGRRRPGASAKPPPSREQRQDDLHGQLRELPHAEGGGYDRDDRPESRPAEAVAMRSRSTRSRSAAG